MTNYLLSLIVPRTEKDRVKAMTATAVALLSVGNLTVKRTDLGVFQRPGSGRREDEVLALVALAQDADFSLGELERWMRSIERALRDQLRLGGVKTGEVRVFVPEGEGEEPEEEPQTTH